MYRVAEIKNIPPCNGFAVLRRVRNCRVWLIDWNCNFSTTVWDFIPKFVGLWERSCCNFEIKKNILVFSKIIQLWLYKYSMPYFQFCTEYLTATYNFHCQKTLTVITNTKIWHVVHFNVCSKCPSPAFTQARSLFGSSIRLCWSSLVAAGPISTAELSWAHRCSPAGLKWLVYSVQA